MTDTLPIHTASGTYPIVFGKGLLTQLAAHITPYAKGHKLFIVTDEQIAEHYLPAVQKALIGEIWQVETFVIPAGEQSKSFEQFESLCEAMLAAQPDRKTTLLALGGGVVGDLTGFIASVLLRGVPFIQIPTTLLAQVDSSVGGKTAINCKAGKNLIGSFYQPSLVLMDSDTLTTLPERELLAGYAEVLKYGLLGDASFYGSLLEDGQRALTGDTALLQRIIHHCCKMKADIVSQDEKEQGKRALLNLGHTFGHALEKAADYDGRVLHGEAVALGCLMAMQLSTIYGNVTAQDVATLRSHYETVGLPTSLQRLHDDLDWDAEMLTSYCYQDKKATDGGLTFITLEHIGDARIRKDIPAKVITEIFREFLHG